MSFCHVWHVLLFCEYNWLLFAFISMCYELLLVCVKCAVLMCLILFILDKIHRLTTWAQMKGLETRLRYLEGYSFRIPCTTVLKYGKETFDSHICKLKAPIPNSKHNYYLLILAHCFTYWLIIVTVHNLSNWHFLFLTALIVR